MFEHDFRVAKHENSYFFSSPYNHIVIFDVIVFPLAAVVLFRDIGHKNA